MGYIDEWNDLANLQAEKGQVVSIDSIYNATR